MYVILPPRKLTSKAYHLIHQGLPIAGQSELLQKLNATIDIGEQPHAWLFIDENGFGGLPLALYCAAKMLYTEEQLQKKNISNSVEFKKLLDHPDFHVIFPTVLTKSKSGITNYRQQWLFYVTENPYCSYSDWISSLELGEKKGIISVKDIESLHDDIYLKSFFGGNRVCIIWGLEKLHNTASNKFLKLLEEPPEKTYFLLIAQEKSSLLPTILSRCQIISLKPVDKVSLKDFFKEKYNTGVNEMALQSAKGSVRELLNSNYLEGNTSTYENLFVDLLRNSVLSSTKKSSWIDLTKTMEKILELNKEKQKEFLLFGMELIRQAFFYNCRLTPLVYYQSKSFSLKKLSNLIKEQNFPEIIELLEKSTYYLNRNGNPKMIFTNLCISLIGLLKNKAKSS